MALTIAEIRRILEAGTFENLVGERESEILDCKGRSYAVEGDRSKFELAKDASSFANARGGFIIIGVETRQDIASMDEIISRVHAFGRNLIDPAQYENILNSWLFPRPTLSVRWYPSAANAERGLFVIEIPEQKDADKPFLIVRLVADDQSRVEMAFGYAERKGTTSQPRTVQEMHRFFRDGRLFAEVIEARFDAIEARLAPEAAPAHRLPNIGSAIALAVSATGDQDRRFISLVTQPNEKTELKTIFNSGTGTIRWALEHPSELRPNGWGLKTLGRARIIEGRLIRVVGGRSRAIDLYRCGTLVFTATADGEFYCWPEEPKINSLALIEAIYNFVRFYALVIGDMVRAPDTYTVCIDFGNFHKEGVASYMMAVGHGEKHLAPQAQWRESLQFTRGEIVDSPGATAYRIVREIYFWFGMEESQIPYTRATGTTTIIDPALLETM